MLIATTNFPLRRRGDRTGNFVVDPILALADRLDQVVLTPLDDHLAARRERFAGAIEVRRFGYWWPRRAQALAQGDGIPTNLRAGWLPRLQLLPLLVVFAWQILRHARDADVVHAHWLPVAVLALPARWRHGTPIVVTLHGTDVTQFPDAAVRWALRRVDVVVSAHDDLLATVARLAPEVRTERIRHLVEPQPVDPAEAADAAALLGEAPLGLFVARLSPERDPVTFVRAVPAALTVAPAARFAVVGDGPLRAEVEAEVARLGLGDRIAVLGHRADVWTFLGRAGAFTALSDRNNVWVTALVEAMRAGVPVVATTAGATADALRHDHDALLVPVADPGAVGAAMGALLADPVRGKRIAAAAHDTLAREGFAPDAVKHATVALFTDLAQARP